MNEPKKIFLKDYKTPDFAIQSCFLNFDIKEEHTSVYSKLVFERLNAQADVLFLNGVDLELTSIKIDGKSLGSDEYALVEGGMKIFHPKLKFTLETEVRIHPATNTTLSGLYKSGDNFLTQCEAEGFRRITYYMDRPDVMSSFTVGIEADNKKFPILLSNGDKIADETKANGRRWVQWRDPFKKPSYLFALVAANLDVLKDNFTTQSGKNVALEIYAPFGKINRCHFAMESLKKSMKWDEVRYGLEYDLSTYMIVATDDFNSGAMENKGLNIFNSRLVLADPESATDANFEAIDSVIAHEYFHNWTGNRITCRDWFHLSLKEGLTVFRDQEYSMDQISRDLVRIENVKTLRSHQFPEDQGPNAHPIRPESCLAVDNFYTATIYEKGAEVIRMMQTMVGRPGFRKGMDEYFKRHDGQAVIIEDFAQSIAEPNQQDWTQFKLWYSQAGTPKVHVREKFEGKTYELHLTQSTGPSPGQPVKKPFHIPLEMELFDSNMKALPLERAIINQPNELKRNTENKFLLHLKGETAILKFESLESKPLLSLNRSFSAPIEVDFVRADSELEILFAKDTDAFSRFEAGQTLLGQTLIANQGRDLRISDSLLLSLKNILKDEKLSSATKDAMLELPTPQYLIQKLENFSARDLRASYHQMIRQIAKHLKSEALAVYNSLHGKFDDRMDPEARGHRALKNWALGLLCWEGQDGLALAEKQFFTSRLMTDQSRALHYLVQFTDAPGDKALDQFLGKWKDDATVMNTFWRVQAAADRNDTFDKVQKLISHPQFKFSNPNCFYSTLGVFGGNLFHFHNNNHDNTDTYEFMASKLIEMDALNPMVAARVASCFDACAKLKPDARERARKTLEKMTQAPLSKNTYEIVSKTLAALS